MAIDNESEYIIEVDNLRQYFYPDRKHVIKAVDGVSFRIKRGRAFGLVGESGSGKTTIGRALIRLYDPSGGRVSLDGVDISGKLSKAGKRYITGKMQMVFQDPMSSLNPRKKVIDIIAEGLDANKLVRSKSERTDRVCAILEQVGLSREFAGRYPHMFSGGQRQRIGIARAIIMEPELIIADECISALDVSIQAQIVNLMKDLQTERNLTYLFIAHDLSMVKYISDDIGVIHAGHLVEVGTGADIFERPAHPYTRSLLTAIPEPNPFTERYKKYISYDRTAEGIDYLKGSPHYITPTHMVLGTDEEIDRWVMQ